MELKVNCNHDEVPILCDILAVCYISEKSVSFQHNRVAQKINVAIFTANFISFKTVKSPFQIPTFSGHLPYKQDITRKSSSVNDRRVSSTLSVTRGGVPPPKQGYPLPGLMGGYPPQPGLRGDTRGGVPPSQV